MEEKEYNTIVLENGIEYTELDIIDNYVFLSEIENPKNFCIRQLETENNIEYIVGLKDKEEFEKALELFNNKYNKN